MRHLRSLSLGFVLAAAACGPKPETAPTDAAKVSTFGEYRGYSDSLYSEWVRESRYVTMRDGTRIAVDIIRPAVNGKAVDRKMPVVWTHSRYHRGAAPREAMLASNDLSALRGASHPKAGDGW
ncbi:MAG: hypothetical protein IT352_09060, partial [Gemmatimonadales bacterium]|nr:hypothetical protein [Gemmatimonadales bacterium]